MVIAVNHVNLTYLFINIDISIFIVSKFDIIWPAISKVTLFLILKHRKYIL